MKKYIWSNNNSSFISINSHKKICREDGIYICLDFCEHDDSRPPHSLQPLRQIKSLENGVGSTYDKPTTEVSLWNKSLSKIKRGFDNYVTGHCILIKWQTSCVKFNFYYRKTLSTQQIITSINPHNRLPSPSIQKSERLSMNDSTERNLFPNAMFAPFLTPPKFTK